MNFGAMPPLLGGFAATIALAVIIGLELHAYRRRGGKTSEAGLGFGSTRTITLIAAAGFALWSLGPAPYCVGLAVLGGLLGLDYHRKLGAGDATLLPSVIGILAFLLGPVMLTAPVTVTAALAVVILFALGEQDWIRRFSDAFPAEEGVTLAKFLVLAGLVLPLLPSGDIPGLTGISYTKVWMTVLVISGISYLGYLAHRYLFPQAGSILTGVLGGLYSSTAATVVLARSAKAAPESRLVPAAVVVATAMMYLRLLAVIALLGHLDTARALAPPFTVFFLGSLGVALLLARLARGSSRMGHPPVSRNPLDLLMAFGFAAMFVAFAAITQFVTARFGANGLHLLSFAVGFSDIDPFIFSLLDGRFQVPAAAIVTAVLIAAGSNNLLKAGYALALSRQRTMLAPAAWLVLTLALSLAYTWLIG